MEIRVGSTVGQGVLGGGTAGQLGSMKPVRPVELGAPGQGHPVRGLMCVSPVIQGPSTGQELVKLDLTLK